MREKQGGDMMQFDVKPEVSDKKGGKLPNLRGVLTIKQGTTYIEVGKISLWDQEPTDKHPVKTGTIEFSKAGTVEAGEKVRVALWTVKPKGD